MNCSKRFDACVIYIETSDQSGVLQLILKAFIIQLERQLENVESEKAGLSTNVREVQDNLESSRKELAAQKVKTVNITKLTMINHMIIVIVVIIVIIPMAMSIVIIT